MEESDLLKERFQAITEKHRIQEHIRQKKLELDQEKLKLQHLKKKALREQWLLQDSTSATDSQKQQSLLSDQQQTRVLQLNIHKIEMEILSLEREESMISTNESLILNRLKAVEKSPEEIIKEAHVNFVSEPLQVTIPESPSPSELNTPRKTPFAMEINVTKNRLTGENTVLSTAAVPPEELNQHAGLKVYDDGRKCVYALNSQEGSHDFSCISELSANEVEQLLRSATVHRQGNYHQNSSMDGHYLCNHQDERDRLEGYDLRNQEGQCGNHVLNNNIAEKDLTCKENWQRHPQHEHCYGHQENNNHNNLRESHHFENHKRERLHCGNQIDHHYSSYIVSCNSVQEDLSASHHANGFIRSNSRANGGRPNGCPPAIPHHQDVMTRYQPQLSDYNSADEELYCYSQSSQTESSHNQSTALYSSHTASDRVPSPLYGDDIPYTILNTLDTTEPITAIFMGFQAAQDDSGQSLDFVGSLKAELVIIEDNEQNSEDNNMKKKKSHTQPDVSNYSSGSAASGNLGCVEERRTERQVGPGIRKIRKKHKPCCTVC